MIVWSLFIIDLMGLFFYTKIGSIRSIGDLPTTNIIEPLFCAVEEVERTERENGTNDASNLLNYI